MNRGRFSGVLESDLGASSNVGFTDRRPSSAFRQDHHTLSKLSPLGYFFVGACYAEASEWAAHMLGSGATPQLLFDRNILWVNVKKPISPQVTQGPSQSALRIANQFQTRWNRIRSWNRYWITSLSHPPGSFDELTVHLRQVRWYMQSAWKLHFLIQFALREVMEQALSELSAAGRQSDFLERLHGWPSEATSSALFAKSLLSEVSLDDPGDMLRAVRHYVSRYGDRLCGALDVSEPTLTERPALLEGLSAALDRQPSRRPREPNWVRAHPLLHIAWCSNYFWWSEEHNGLFEGQSLIPLRRTAQKAGNLLKMEEDAVFMLFIRELEEALRAHRLSEDVRSMASVRAVERADHSHAREKSPLHWRGQGASPGKALGRVHVRLGLDERAVPSRGFVLLASGVAANWLPLIERAAACVVSQAGITTHAAIICRQMGIPCVVGIPPANLSPELEGCEIYVDGDTGAVTVSDP